ncbi:hypothetical protein BZZ52_005129 [Escherichia coli]|nr:hypothetical protein [Escherichia coli]
MNIMPQNGPDDQVEDEKKSLVDQPEWMKNEALVSKLQLLNMQRAANGEEPLTELPPLPPAVDALSEEENEQLNAFIAERQKQIQANKVTAAYERKSQDEIIPAGRIFTLEEMLNEFVYVGDTDTVVSLKAPQANGWKFGAFCRLTGDSFMPTIGNQKPQLVANAWMNDPRMIRCGTRTMDMSKGRVFIGDDGQRVLNLWTGLPMPYRTGADTSLAWEHFQYLIPDEQEREDFINFLAHMVQRPEDLPQIYFVHVATAHGTGRGWVVQLIRKLIGRYATTTTLKRLLNDGFNAKLSGRLMIMVEECSEGRRSDKFERERRLREISNASVKEIERKGVDSVDEINYSRLFMMANDGDAIATGSEDRRAYVITFSGKTKEELLGKSDAEAYFNALYALLADPAFIQQFYFELATRDISGFNSHMRAPMTSGKIAMIESNKTEGQLLVDQLIADWPSDIITNKDFTSILTEDGAVRHVDSRQIKYCWDGDKNPTVENLFRFGVRHNRGRILRNADKWLNASGAERNAEVERAWRERSKGDKPLAATASELWTKHMS